VGLLGLGRVDMPPTGDLALVRLASRRSRRRATADDTRALLAPYGEWAGLAGAYLLAHPLSAPGPVPGG
jgi:3-methyladenine DNA glycosylase/8-oxoguanine DNA glycosylase